MSAIWTREMLSYLYSPLFWGLAAAFYALGGYFFTVNLMGTQTTSLFWYFGDAAFVLLFLSPLLTMRLFAEERTRGTDELLFTLPLPTWKVVLGKYLASLCVLGLLFASSIVYLFILVAVGEPEWGPITSSYLGVLLLGGLFLSVGLFASSLTSSQLLAAVGGFFLLLLLWISGWAADTFPGAVGETFRQISVSARLEDFLRGILDTGHVVFFLSLILAFLGLTTLVLEKRVTR